MDAYASSSSRHSSDLGSTQKNQDEREQCATEGKFTTIDVNALPVSRSGERATSWQHARPERHSLSGSSLHSYKTYSDNNRKLDNPKDLVIRGKGIRFNRRQRRLLSILLCVVVCAISVVLIMCTINWAEENRKNENDSPVTLEVEMRSMQDKIDSMHLQINKLKEIVYANTVAINELTFGAMKMPGSDGNSSKRQKFGKHTSTINQTATHQRFDRTNIPRSGGANPSDQQDEVDLHPIVHQAQIM